ncbi:MAG: hypothetical protein EBR08_00395 [Bacteroidia bacterium]|nr:hypothetical protein [Bacteroidia bacterium]
MNKPLSFWTGLLMLVFICVLLVLLWIPGTLLNTQININKPGFSAVLLFYAIYRAFRLYRMVKS